MSVPRLVQDSALDKYSEYKDTWPPMSFYSKENFQSEDLPDIWPNNSTIKKKVKKTTKPTFVFAQVKKAKPTFSFARSAVKRVPKFDMDSVAKFIEQSDKCAHFYTGLTKEQRETLWDFLGGVKDELLIYKTGTKSGQLRTISVRSQFLLTLMILRRNRRFTDIHFHFHIGQALVGRIFKTWIQFMFHKFKDIKAIMFVKKADIKKPLPACFDNPFCRDTRVVIDCTEIFTESSTDFKQQGHLHSSYKSHTTAKVLLGVAPSGACSFVSDCFEGCISDVDIVKQSGFLDYMEKGDVVLADRGFTIEDLLAPMGAKLNMPAFLRGKKAFTLSDKQKGQVFAKARIHVERFNQCFKRFEFVSGRVYQKHLPILSQVVYVCCCLTNFTRRLADVKPPVTN
jgi:hypothetical protein